MTLGLLSALLFEAAALAVSAMPLALGQPGMALLVFAVLHLPSSLLLVPILVVASSVFDTKIYGGGLWPSILPVLGVCAVVGIQFPLLIACFRWHTAERSLGGQKRWAIAARSVGVFGAASLAALLVAAVCLLMTPVCSRSTCIDMLPGEPPRKDHWQVYGGYSGMKAKAVLRPFGTLRNQAFTMSYQAWWGSLRFHSPWRFGMLGLYVALGCMPALWIVVRWRRQPTSACA